MTLQEYFEFNRSVNKRGYDSLHDFFVGKLPEAEAASRHGYTLTSFYSLVRDFRRYLKESYPEDFFFKDTVLGRKPVEGDDLKAMVVSLCKMNFSIEEIVAIAQSQSYEISYGLVCKILQDEGFARLPRRSEAVRVQLELPPMKAPVAGKLAWKAEKFHSSHTGLFAFLPVIYRYGIHKLIESSAFPPHA